MSAGGWPPYPPYYPPSEPPRRTRREHKKSRNGCQPCKRRRVRCDEQHPICSNCLVRGDSCVYDRPEGSAVDEGQPSSSTAGPVVMASTSNPMSGAAADPFDSLEVDMPYNSYELLHHFASYRNELRSMVFPNSNIPESVLTSIDSTHNPAYKRSVMLMAAKHNYGLTGSCDWSFAPAYLHHKAEIIRLVMQQVHERPDHPGDWSFIVIFFLISMESLNRDHQAAETHLRGLMTLLETIRQNNQELYQAGYALLKIGLICLSLVEAAKKPCHDPDALPPAWRHTNSPFAPPRSWTWASVAYLLSHFVFEFFVRGDCLLSPGAKSPGDAACVKWLIGAIQTIRVNHELQIGHQDPQEREWVLSGACYALALIGLLESPSASGEGYRGSENPTMVELQALKRWWEDIMAAWISSRTLPSWELSLGVLEKLAFLTSPPGEAVLAQLQQEVTSA